jgi:MinD superfamily P-loop ATPase
MVVADCDVDTANLHLILQPEDYIEEKFVTGQKAVINYSTCTNCGLCVNYCRFDAMAFVKGKVVISETSCDGCKLCARVCASQSITMVENDKSRWYVGNYRNGKLIHARLAPGEENSGKLVNVVREQARRVAKETGCEAIVIDGPPGTGCPVISSVTGANRVVVVTEPSNSGFHDMKRLLELVANFNIKAFVVINKYDLNKDVTASIETWCNQQNIPVVGKLIFYEPVVHAMVRCKSIIEYLPDSEISKEIYRIFDIIFNQN